MNNDIVSLYQNIQNNIRIVEKGDYNDETLLNINNDFLSLLELIKLFLITERDTYYGYFMMNLSFNVDVNSKSIAGIKLNTYPPVFESNPLLLCKFNLKNIIYIVCHEIDHIVFNHPKLMVEECNENQDLLNKFNIAADAAVNDAINEEIILLKHDYMSFPDGCITSETVADMIRSNNVWANQSYKYYFDLLNSKKIKNKDNHKDRIINNRSKTKDKSDNVTSNDCSGINDNNSLDSNDLSKKIVTSKNCPGIEDHNWSDSDDPSEINECVRQLLNEVNDSIPASERGTMPSKFNEAIKEINEPPKINWQSLLKKYIGTISANYTHTRTRLNRRQPNRFDLSGKKSEKVLKIVVALDTSGSMSDEDIAYIFNEIFEIIGKRKHDITIIECDAAINKVYKVKNRSDIQLKVTGRGGTSFVPVIEYINSNKYYRDSLLIYFTDGFGDASIPRPNTYRNLWVVLKDEEYLSLKEPYGSVIALK